MSGLPEFIPAEKPRTRTGRKWLEDSAFVEAVSRALKTTYDEDVYLSTTVVGMTELRKMRGAIRYFVEEEGWGLSLSTKGDESETAPADEPYTITFRAMQKNTPEPSDKPRKVRRRQTETEDEYVARIRDMYPMDKKEKQSDYDARIATVYSPAKPAATPAA